MLSSLASQSGSPTMALRHSSSSLASQVPEIQLHAHLVRSANLPLPMLETRPEIGTSSSLEGLILPTQPAMGTGPSRQFAKTTSVEMPPNSELWIRYAPSS